MYPGQNIRISHYTNFPQTNIRKELQNGILDWFNEYADVKSDIIDKYENRPGHKQYGHFTAMAKDNNNRIGKIVFVVAKEMLKHYLYPKKKRLLLHNI